MTAQAAAPQEPRATVSKGSILVVEDSRVNQMVALGVVRKLGYTVEVASNGEEALVAMAAGGFDAVLMDCHMPTLDGFDATIEWRRRESETAAERLPIIAMTAGVMAEDRSRCTAAGMDDFVAKPIQIDLLERTLSSWVTPRERRGGSTAVTGVSDSRTQRTTRSAAVDASRLELLRGMGPDDGWGLLPAVAEAFTSDSVHQLATIRSAAAAGDAVALEAAAHKLKGAASNLGASAVASLCADLEGAARRGDVSGSDALARLAEELERAGAALEGALAGRS